MTTPTPYLLPTFRDYTTWHLANRADCSSPDRPDAYGLTPPPSNPDPSPGAQFLRRVADDTAELIERAFGPGATDARTLGDDLGVIDHLNYDGSLSEVADAAVPIYTGELWSTFVDLGAYTEDPSAVCGDDGDMVKMAGVCLYMIGERLASGLVIAWAGELDFDAEDVEA